MSYKKRHNEIAKAFSDLNDILEDKKDAYLEKISNIINKAIKNFDDKEFWEQSYKDIVDYFYAALTDVYLETTITLKKIYAEISDKVVDIEDFIYKEDKITLPKRIKKYWDEVIELLKNPKTDKKEIALYLLAMYDRILTNETINVKQGIKKVKKPIDNDGIEVICITNGVCCSNGGVYLADEAPALPPYHNMCECEFWYEFYYPTDEEDLEALQELGWEKDDG